MNFSALQLVVVIFVPILLTAIVWRYCRSEMAPGAVAGAFFLGVISVWPVVQLSNLITGVSGGLSGHYYADELLQMIFATAIPEELGKGATILFVMTLAGARNSLKGWLACGAAAHSGFAALEGMLSALGDEGLLKVLVGRSFGALSHCSWGIIMAWFLWRGGAPVGSRWGNWAAALLVPVLLHAIVNASRVEVPGTADLPDDVMPSLAAMLIMLSGLGGMLASVGFAAAILVHARRRGEAGVKNESLAYCAA